MSTDPAENVAAPSLPSTGSSEAIPQHLWEYALEQDQLKAAAEEVKKFLEATAAEVGIKYHAIEARAKNISSYKKKTERIKDDGTPKYRNPIAEIDDTVAARVIVFTTRAREGLVQLLTTRLKYKEDEAVQRRKPNGYDSDHIIAIGFVDPILAAHYSEMSKFFRKHPGLEIQIRTVAGHAWAEYEHDAKYKSSAYDKLEPKIRETVDSKFVDAGDLRRMMDRAFEEIETMLLPSVDQAPPQGTDDSEVSELETASGKPEQDLTQEDITELVGQRYPTTEVGDINSIHEILLQLKSVGITSLSALLSTLAKNDINDVADRMNYSSFPIQPTGTRRLDDELLAALGDRYVESASDSQREQVLRLRQRMVRGGFAIYELIVDGERGRPTTTGARTVRELAKLVADRAGLNAAVQDGLIAVAESEISSGYYPRPVKTEGGTLYIATNITRDTAERVMRRLIDQMPLGTVQVLKAGDPLA